MDERELDEWQLLQAVCDPRKRGPMQRAGRELDSVGAGWDPRQDAARKRLRECSDHQQACEAIREIVSNLMGCEEMALLRLDCGSGSASMIWSFGLDREAFRLSQELRNAAMPALIAGEAYVYASNDNGKAAKAEISALIPIQFRGITAGVLVLFKLLPQKSAIEECDRESFTVLSREAGRPLFAEPARNERKR